MGVQILLRLVPAVKYHHEYMIDDGRGMFPSISSLFFIYMVFFFLCAQKNRRGDSFELTLQKCVGEREGGRR